MKLDSPMFKVRIRGELACFTRPEMKVERVSYEVITPSAARGVVEAVLWKPAICWVIGKIHVLAPVRWTSFKRNEVNGKVPAASVKTAMKGGGRLKPLVVDESKIRAQRNTLALRDVDYVVEVGFCMTDKAGSADNPTKFSEMFQRRLKRGQCYRMPYLGCREFVAQVSLQEEPFGSLPESRDLGWMLHDIEFRPTEDNLPHFFHAQMQNGVIEVPELVPGLQVQGGPA